MATPNDTVGTGSNKMATQDAQGTLTTLIDDAPDGGHLANPESGDEEVRL